MKDAVDRTINWKRALLSGAWGALVFHLGRNALDSNLSLAVLVGSALVIPWVFLYIYEANCADEKAEAGGALIVGLMGGIISLVTTAPAMLLFGLVMKIPAIIKSPPSKAEVRTKDPMPSPHPLKDLKKSGYVNSLGMRFASVSGTGVLFSVWETRGTLPSEVQHVG